MRGASLIIEKYDDIVCEKNISKEDMCTSEEKNLSAKQCHGRCLCEPWQDGEGHLQISKQNVACQGENRVNDKGKRDDSHATHIQLLSPCVLNCWLQR